MFFNQRSCCSRCCRHCCGCGHDSNQITGTVTGYLPDVYKRQRLGRITDRVRAEVLALCGLA